MNQDGSRLLIHPADVKGKWNRRRRVVFGVLIALYLAAPFLSVNGRPFLRLDVQQRRFFFLGATFNAQDVWLLLLLVLAFLFGLLAVTAWRGRVWCGWACPQTVFLEGLYRPIERFFEGSREQRIRLSATPMNWNKFARRAAKYSVFFALSVLIAHTAAALFVAPRELLLMMTEGPVEHFEAFVLTVGFTAILTFNFTWFREQFCVVLCPYGRLQSVLHDKHSVTVAYRTARGEPRGKVNTPGAADCIDCRRCVVVCPTGIDIRNGLQMECLACTQCIDACDDVMTKLSRPRGLIDFASQAELAGGKRRAFTPRVLLYTGAMTAIVLVLSLALALRSPFEANVVRPRGAMPYVVDGAYVRNTFELHLVNKSPDLARFDIRIDAPPQATVMVSTPHLELASFADARVPVVVSMPQSALSPPPQMELIVTDVGAKTELRRKLSFLSPPPF